MTDSANQAEKNAGFFNTLISFAVVVALALGVAFLLRELFAYGYMIPSGSMEETIMTGDTVLSEKVSYMVGEIEQGDIVPFIDPENTERILIKRVIAVGGQSVDLINGEVYVDGERLSEPYVNGKESIPLSSSLDTITFPYLVLEGYIWVMGDNRTNSQDSRYFGAVPEENVLGRAYMVYWPLDRFGVLE